MVDTYLHKSNECTTPIMSPNVNQGLDEIMKGQCRFISYNKCNSVAWDVSIEKKQACAGTTDLCKLTVISTKCFCDPKTALKIDFNHLKN